MIAAITDVLAPALVGCDPLDVSICLARMDKALYANNTTKAAVDMAIWDIIGKSLGKPIYQLLGGIVQNNFTTTWCIGWNEPDKMLEDARKYIAEGYNTFEVKMSGNLAEDLIRIRMILDHCDPGVCFIFDPNNAWSVSEPIEAGRALAGYKNKFYFEQPSPKDDLPGMARVRAGMSIRIIADEPVRTPRIVYEIARLGAADMVNIKLAKTGGFTKSLEAIAVAKAAGVPYRVDCMCESKIGNTAGTHLAAATGQVLAGLDSHLHCVTDPVVEGGLVVREGRVTISDAPGLGIKVGPEWA